MIRILFATACFLVPLTGCQREEVGPSPPAKKGEINIEVPGVKIDIKRSGEQDKKKLDVDIQVPPK